MTTYFVTRHAGAIEWLQRNGIAAMVVEHLDPGQVRPGDVVLGTLPVHIVGALNAKGARFKHLAYDAPPELRGQELSADDLERLGAKLVEYRVERVDQS
jgi:CRISPR-associated protein Csx16